MIRQDISRLRKNRGLHFSIGLSISLAFCIMAFNYEVAPPVYHEQEILVIDHDIEFESVITKWPDRKPPPPPQPKLAPIVIPTDDPIPEIFEPEKKFEIETDGKEVVVAKPSPKPMAPPPPKPLPKPQVEEIHKVVQEMPRFGDCEDLKDEKERKICSDRNIMQYVHGQLKYPSMARETGIEGTVVATFVVEKDGSLSNIKIARDIGGGCGDEVIRVLRGMPTWSAGKQQGRKVKVQFNIPVKFQLQ